MKLKKIHIQNYKSLVDLEIVEPNPFTVFAGPNGSGKSNIFEALEFMAYNSRLKMADAILIFGGQEIIINVNSTKEDFYIGYEFDDFVYSIELKGNESSTSGKYLRTNVNHINPYFLPQDISLPKKKISDIFFTSFLRFFIRNSLLNRIRYTSDTRLLPDASNMEPIIKEIISTPNSEEFIDWLQLFVPGFENIEIHSDNISGRDSLLIYEKGTKKPFTKNLISDGTYNILCLLAAVYQAKEPQFLCIEEPENGLNPYVVRSLVEFFRTQCEEKGHYIWLNTHSQTLVKELKPHELILVDKVDGATRIKQFPKDYNIYSLDMDEAWLSNALGGGIPW